MKLKHKYKLEYENHKTVIQILKLAKVMHIGSNELRKTVWTRKMIIEMF
jgi:phage antirepressor YoqD-like protein